MSEYFWGFSQLRICKPFPPSPSVLIQFLLIMRNVLKLMNNKFSDFYFSNYSENSSKIGVMTSQNMTITRKICIRKIWSFFRFSRFRIFPVNFITLKKKIGKIIYIVQKRSNIFDFFFGGVLRPPPKYIQDLGFF